MRVRCSLLLVISLLALLASGCGSSRRATPGTTSGLILVPKQPRMAQRLSPAVRAAIRRLRANEHRSVIAMVGIDGCYRLVRDHRTHKLTAARRKHC